MSEYRSVLERAASNFAPLDLPLERVERGRDRRGRNRRIAAGVVGIAVFVAAVWIVTNGLSLDRTTPAVPGSKTGSAETAPSPARASAPDVERKGSRAAFRDRDWDSRTWETRSECGSLSIFPRTTPGGSCFGMDEPGLSLSTTVMGASSSWAPEWDPG